MQSNGCSLVIVNHRNRNYCWCEWLAYKYTRNVTLIKAAVASFAKYTSLQYSMRNFCMHLVQLSGFVAPAYIIIVVTCEAMPAWYMPIPCVWLSATIWCSTEKTKCRTMQTTPLTMHICANNQQSLLSMVDTAKYCQWSIMTVTVDHTQHPALCTVWWTSHCLSALVDTCSGLVGV